MWQVTHLEERKRSMSMRLYGLDQPHLVPHDELDQIATLTRDAVGSDAAGVNLILEHTQVTVGSTMTPGYVVPRDDSICSVALQVWTGPDLIEIPDLREEPLLAGNPYVDGRLASLRFYVAAPLIGKHGLALGTLCAWSDRPQWLDDHQRALLRQLGRAAVNVLDERRRALVTDHASGALRPAR